MNVTDKQRVITYISIFYGYNKREAEKAYNEYTEERKKALLENYNAACRKAFYYD